MLVLVTVNDRIDELLMTTVPKSNPSVGSTDSVPLVAAPLPVTDRVAPPPPVKLMLVVTVPVLVGENFTWTLTLALSLRL